MDFRNFLQNNVVYLDGGTGTLLQKAGLPVGELPERWNLTHAEEVISIHRAYFDAGSNVVCTNTFGANVLKYSERELESIIAAAIENAKSGARRSNGMQEKFIALDIGPTGKLLKPYGELDFERAVEIFAKTVRLGVKYGADLIFLETFSDSLESKAALLAVKENSALPVLVSNAYGADGKLTTGASPAAMVAMLEDMGADGIGANCSLGPNQLSSVVEELLAKASVPVLVKPNAGLPQTDGGCTYYDVDEKAFAKAMANFVRMGVRLVGGCCGTTPAYVRGMYELTKAYSPLPIKEKDISCVSSYTHTVEFDKPVIIGERINPTGKKAFKQALLEDRTDYALNEAVAQQEKGAEILDVNVGLPGIDETAVLERYVQELQAVTDLPLQIDTSNPLALERALRVYNGKPLVNSVNGKKESMAQVFPLVKKYGGAVVALTLDENGIPDTWEGRVRIAEKIIAEAAKYGIKRKDIFIDTLTMSVATDKNAANVTLRALKYCRQNLGVHTVLGVSNVSFGLPSRDVLNAAFFAMALQNGLSAAILNPFSLEMQKTYRAFLALSGKDENSADYIRFISEDVPKYQPIACGDVVQKTGNVDKERSPLRYAIVNGLKENASRACAECLREKTPLEVIDGDIVPALDEVGNAYETKRAYLPQLLISAEAAKSAFEVLKTHIAQTGKKQEKKCKIVLATVHGDIHDIGKNIVKTLLETYGFDVIDLGRDVPCGAVVSAVEANEAPLVGLSALMTTTLPSMQETVRLLRERTPDCKIVVGGAVLTAEYAQKIGADAYTKDAMETVRYAEKIYKDLCNK